MVTGRGNDAINAGGGNDIILTGGGDDAISGGGGNDFILSGQGHDVVYSGAGDDWVRAGDGDDTVAAGGGHNDVDLGNGDDVSTLLWSEAAVGSNRIDGGRGQDVLRVVLTAEEAQDASVRADLAGFQSAVEGEGFSCWGRWGFNRFSGDYRFESIDAVLRDFEMLEIHAPVLAADDAAGTVENGGPVTIDVLANDTDLLAADSAALAVTDFDTSGVPAGASLFLNHDGTFTFDAGTAFEWLAGGETVQVSFGYTVSDDQGFAATATATITVEGRNDVAVVDAVDPATGSEAAVSEVVSFNLFEDLTTISDADAADTQGYAGNAAVVAAADSATTDTTLVWLAADGTVSYDRADFAFLAEGEAAVYEISFDVTSGPETARQTVVLTITGDDPVVSGVGADGYYVGALVFRDADGDGTFDDGEAHATTDGSGAFTLQGGHGDLVMTGGFDVATGVALDGSLRAPSGASVVTPLTTLVWSLMQGGMTLAEAEAAVIANLGLPSDADLLHTDFIAATLAGETGGSQLALAATQVQNIVAAISAVYAGTESGSAGEVGDGVYGALAGALSSPLNLSDAEALESIAAAAGGNLGIDPATLAATIAGAAQAAAGANAAAAAGSAAATDGQGVLSAVTQAAIVAQNDAAGAIAAAAAEEASSGPGAAVAALAGYSGSALEDLIEQAADRLGDIDGAANNNAPTATPNAISLESAAPYAFSLEDFGFADIDFGDSLEAITVSALPDSGLLTLDGTPVTVGQTIAAADVGAGLFRFTPAANGIVELGLTVSDGEAASSAATLTIETSVAPPSVHRDLATIEENASVEIDVLANDEGDGLRIVSAYSMLGSPVSFSGDIGDGLSFSANGEIALPFVPRYGQHLAPSWDHLPEGGRYVDLIAYEVEDALGRVTPGATFEHKTFDFGEDGDQQVNGLDLDGVEITGSSDLFIGSGSLGIVGGPRPYSDVFIDAGESLTFTFDRPSTNIRFGGDSFWSEGDVRLEGFDAEGQSLGELTVPMTSDGTGFDGNFNLFFGGQALSRLDFEQLSGNTRLKQLEFDAIEGDGYAAVIVGGIDDEVALYDIALTMDEDQSRIFVGSYHPYRFDVDGTQTPYIVPLETPELGWFVNNVGSVYFHNNYPAYPESNFNFLAEGETYEVVVPYTVRTTPEPDPATLTITVEGANDAPVAERDVYATTSSAVLTANVLSNDLDPDMNDRLTVIGVKGGSVGTPFTIATLDGDTAEVTLTADGTFTFDPQSVSGTGSASGWASITYYASDGHETTSHKVEVTWGQDIGATATASQNVLGTGGDDDIAFLGTEMVFEGLVVNPVSGETAGRDGWSGLLNDAVYDGGDGHDTLVLPAKKTSFLFIEDAVGQQMLNGIEAIVGESKASAVLQLASQTIALGDLDIDLSTGGGLVWSNAGNDTIRTGPADDRIDGGAGDDTIAPGTGIDELSGGLGDDLFVFEASSGAKTITDFTAGALSEDVIDISEFGFDSGPFPGVSGFDAVLRMASDTNLGVEILLDDSTTLTLLNVHRGDLHADDFVLA